jgi:anti-sigma regulatory factor (Ser/Thr protein kinase)
MSPSVTRTFPAEARSVPAARRFVRDLVLAGGHERWVGDAQLAVSEVCTNAVLHAHSPFEVTVRVAPEGVYVQVWDDDPGLPARRVSAATSTTGRGLELLGAVTSSSGSQTVGPTKVVWFCLGAVAPDVGDDGLLDRWRDPPGGRRRARRDRAWRSSCAACRCRCGSPLASTTTPSCASSRSTSRSGTTPPGRCRWTSWRPTGPAASSSPRSGPPAAAAASTCTCGCGPEQARWFEALRDVLDRAERLARSGALLAPPGPPEIVAVRHWATGQVLAQLRGAAPTAWTGPLELPSASAERWAAGGDLADSA